MKDLIALLAGLAGLIGALANAVVQIYHCRRDKKLFRKAGIE